MISAVDASLVYQDHGREVFACRDIDLTIGPAEFVGILGPSGSGKSSLLYLLSGLKDPTGGDVLFEKTPYSRMEDTERSSMRLRSFGFVFQQPFLLGYLTALENVVLVGPATADARDRAIGLLESVGLSDKVHRLPAELSGGEKQRVCVARALFAGPKVVFADEPTASLDHASGSAVIRLLSERKRGSLIVVTHDPSMLVSADRVLCMEDGRVTGHLP
ncbi:MAG: ATP-binding cassette domain-containing protein [Armatimonadota bacterium]|nr:ATP-binding cassette domain-containing protein [Armatimonadota bacterium]